MTKMRRKRTGGSDTWKRGSVCAALMRLSTPAQRNRNAHMENHAYSDPKFKII